MTVQKKERESGIELLRILLMLQVVFLHICSYGTYSKFGSKAGGMDGLLYWVVMMLSRTPVYMYIVIMGYFMISKEMTMKDAWNKIKSIYLVVIFYSVGIWLIFTIASQLPFEWADKLTYTMNIKNIIRCFLPFLTKIWPFMTTYLLILFFAPFINRALKEIPKQTYQILIGVLFFIFSIWIVLTLMEPTKQVLNLNKIINNDDGKSLYSVVFMYILGGYIRRFAPHHEKAKPRYLLIGVGLALINVVFTYKVPGYRNIVLRNDNPISIIEGVMWLMYFKDLKLRSKIINTIARHNLGVYIIHEHPILRPIIWNNIVAIDITTFYSTKCYPFKLLGIGIAIYAICIVVDMGRERLFRWIGNHYNKRRRKVEVV